MAPKWWLVSLAVAGFNADFNLKGQKLNLSNPYKNTFVFSLALLVISPTLLTFFYPKHPS